MSSTTSSESTLLGHPTGLFVLFFAEMWERFSYYGMRALLTFYMIKSFLGYSDSDAYAVYGAYTAIVYLTPFFGGMLADRLLGQRRAVILGGLLMSTGHLAMTYQEESVFFLALGLIAAGNGFFKPNVSTMVGALYPQGDGRRDGGFTIFYMGINLGAALAPLLCGYVGETYGWHSGFGLATFGMLIGLSIFWAPTRLAQGLILGGALTTAIAMIYVQRDQPWFMLALYAFMALVLVVSAGFAFRALGRGGLPDGVGAPPNPEALHRPVLGLPAQWAVVVGTLALVPVFALLIAGSRSIKLLDDAFLEGLRGFGGLGEVAATVLGEMSSPAGLILTVCGVGALTYLLREAFRMPKVARERMYVVLILISLNLLFWSFFEQAGSSMANFTDRNVERVIASHTIGPEDIGRDLTFKLATSSTGGAEGLPPLSQAQLGYRSGSDEINRVGAVATERRQRYAGGVAKTDLSPEDEGAIEQLVQAVQTSEALSMTALASMREVANGAEFAGKPMQVSWRVTEDNLGMRIASSEVPASTFQAANPMFILIFGLAFTMLWGYLNAIGLEPSTPAKFALGLLQLALGFGALWVGAQLADARGMVGVAWLVLGYLLHTTGELCLSPVGLSMITRLTPARLVSTAMGAWFLATAFSSFLAAVIAQFTQVGHGGEGVAIIPLPIETVDIYGSVFGKIAIAGLVCSLAAFALVPKLKRWSHVGVVADE